jgi:hypothetical protein
LRTSSRSAVGTKLSHRFEPRAELGRVDARALRREDDGAADEEARVDLEAERVERAPRHLGEAVRLRAGATVLVVGQVPAERDEARVRDEDALGRPRRSGREDDVEDRIEVVGLFL